MKTKTLSPSASEEEVNRIIISTMGPVIRQKKQRRENNHDTRGRAR